MNNLISFYQKRLDLQNAGFLHINHEDAMVAIVYKVVQPDGINLILKICPRPHDYLREVFFLKHFAEQVPVPRIVQLVEPGENHYEAILMECLQGRLLTESDLTNELAHEMGCFLAKIHLNRTAGYGDLILPQSLNPDPHVHFTQKFLEGLEECSDHLPLELLEQCRYYYDDHCDLLKSVDGPCMIHRDFRAGNVMVFNHKIQGIIDWSSGRASFAEEDFCPLEHGEWPFNPEYKMSFLLGYKTIRPMPDYIKIMPFLRFNRTIATLGFMVKRGIWETSHARLYVAERQFLENLLKFRLREKH